MTGQINADINNDGCRQIQEPARHVRGSVSKDRNALGEDTVLIVPVSRSRSSPVPEVSLVAGSGTTQMSNIMDAISIFIHITHECMHSKKLIMWSHTESDV